MRLANSRIGSITYRGSVTSSFSLPSKKGDKAELIVVAAPKLLAKLDASNQDRVITLNIRLLGPIPYRGGDVDVEVGLFSIPQSDLVEPYLTVLDELSTLAGVSLADPVMPLVDTVKSALNLLVGAQNGTELQIGVLTTLSPLLPGDYCAIRAPRDFAFRRIATTCDDLLIQDGIRLAEMVNKEIDAAFGESVLTSAPGRIYEMPDLDRIPLYDV